MTHRVLFALLAAALPAAAELPSFYRQVDRVFWVVDDIDRTVAGWKKVGIIEAGAQRPGWTVARLGDAIVDFVQPVKGDPFSRQGVFALVHRVPSEAELEREVARMKSAGVAVLATRKAGEGGERYVFFDTAREGKYVLGLCTGSLPVPPSRPGAKRVAQYAFVAADLAAVSRYWAKLGFPEMSFTHPKLWDLRYHGGPGDFDAILGWQKHGKVEYEWIEPTKGPTTYLDHMNKYGEGFHHIAFSVPDIDREMADWSKAGFPTTQSGAWGERGRPGWGRYAYQDVHTIAGTEVELLWNFR